MKDAYGIGRSRDKAGKICGLHLNNYTMCIHTLVGSGWKTMEVLVVEIEDEETENKNSE